MANSLAQFLSTPGERSLALCLPRFTGTQRAADGFVYPGFVHADRDVRCAHEVERLAAATGLETDFIAPEDAAVAVADQEFSKSLFVFGSRSNAALNMVLTVTSLKKLVTFSFSGRDWAIKTRDGRTYSIKDPSSLDRDTYVNSIDFGVVAAVRDVNRPPVFILAGLGSRATEGCGLFLRGNWANLAHRSGGASFAVILKFPPPVDPAHFEEVDFLS